MYLLCFFGSFKRVGLFEQPSEEEAGTFSPESAFFNYP